MSHCALTEFNHTIKSVESFLNEHKITDDFRTKPKHAQREVLRKLLPGLFEIVGKVFTVAPLFVVRVLFCLQPVHA